MPALAGGLFGKRKASDDPQYGFEASFFLVNEVVAEWVFQVEEDVDAELFDSRFRASLEPIRSRISNQLNLDAPRLLTQRNAAYINSVASSRPRCLRSTVSSRIS